jgi:hypothetical protein
MTQEIRWKPYVWDTPRPATPYEASLLEQQWGVKLPEEYKRLISTNQGMTPHPCIFDAGKLKDVMSVLLTIITDPDKKAYAIRDSYSILKPHIPSGIYPFAMTPGSEHLCFDYRASPEEPKIVLVTVDMNVHPVADSFNEFMAKLHD